MQSASFATSTFHPEPPSVCGRRPSITRRTDSPVCSPLAISWNRPGGPDLTFAELVQRVQAKYRRIGIDHPTPLVEGTDGRELVLWARPGAARRAPVLLNRAPNGALTVTVGRLHGLVENSVLAVYPPPGKSGAEKSPLGHVVVMRARPTESDVAAWDEAKAPDFQKKRFTAQAQSFEGGERCKVVMASYGGLKLRVAAAPAGDDGKPLDPASVRRVQEQLKGLGERAKQFVDVAEPPVAQWLVREAAKPAAGKELELFRREGMATGPLAVPGGADKLGARLIEIARAQMLIKLETGDAPPAEDKVKAGEAVAFDIELLRQAGGTGEFRPVPPTSGAGPVLQVGDRVQLRFTNRGKIPVDVTVLQIDQNYDINQFFPQGGATVTNRVALPDQILGPDKGLYTSRQKAQQDGVTGLKDPNGVQRGVHHFVVIGVKGEGEPVDFRDLASPAAGEKDIKRGLPGDARTVLKALQGEGDPRAGFGRDVTEDFVVRVIRFEIECRPPGGK